MNKKVSSKSIDKDILNRTHTKYSSEEKILIIRWHLRRREHSSLCCREGMPATLYTNAGAKVVLSGSRKETA